MSPLWASPQGRALFGCAFVATRSQTLIEYARSCRLGSHENCAGKPDTNSPFAVLRGSGDA